MVLPVKYPGLEEDLVIRSKNGESAAFDALVIKYRDRLYLMIYHMTSNPEDANDLLQETFSRAHQSLQGFRGHSTFYTWIYQIAVNLTLTFLKKQKRIRGISLNSLARGPHLENALIDTAVESNPERGTTIHDLQKNLRYALSLLSHSHRTVVTMFDLQGMSHAQIAKNLGTTQGTVRSRLHYAHQQLQASLQGSWQERY